MTKKELRKEFLKLIEDIDSRTEKGFSLVEKEIDGLQPKISTMSGEINKLKSDRDKTANLLAKLVDIGEREYVVADLQGKKIEALFEFSRMLVDHLNLKLEIIPATEEKRKIVKKSKNK